MRITNFTPRPAWIEAKIDAKIAAAPSGGGGGATTIAGITGLQAILNGLQVVGSYAAASHSHVIAEITGLQAALDARQTAGSYQPLSAILTGTTASFTTAQETKLSGIDAGATANATDANLRDRATHTGAQAISTITGLQTAIDGKATAAAIPNASYRSLLDCTASHVAARVAGTYWFGQGQPAGISGTGTLYAPNLIYIDAADYPTLNGVAPKLRIRAQIYVNDVAPTGNFTLGLYPVTRPATSGGAAVNIFTMGTVVTGSQPAALVAPAADSSNVIVGSDFALPATGHYVLGMVTTATVAVSSHLHISAILQMRNA